MALFGIDKGMALHSGGGGGGSLLLTQTVIK